MKENIVGVVVKWLKDPNIVANFQTRCGITRPITKNINNSGRDLARRKLHSAVTSATNSDDNCSNLDDHTVTNNFLFYFFTLSSNLVSEIFFVSFFTVISWNIDKRLARKTLFIWAYTMYIGQAAKDVLKWARPSSPPVIRLEKTYENEYGMPSTHAMAAVTIAFSTLLFCMHQYYLKENLLYPLLVAVVLSTAVCLSRLYMGVHSVLDVVCGVVSAVALLFLFIPCMDSIDKFQMSDSYLSPLVMVSAPFLLALYYPTSGKWESGRADTTAILATGAGGSLGSWLEQRLVSAAGGVDGTSGAADYNTLVMIVLRTCVGISVVLLARKLVKPLVSFLVNLTSIPSADTSSSSGGRNHLIHKQLIITFVRYLTLTTSATTVAPYAFHVLSIQADT